MYYETEFNELKTLVGRNAELLSQMSILRERIDMLDSAKMQDAESILTSHDAKDLCDEVIRKCDCVQTRSIVSWFKTFYDLIYSIAIDFEYGTAYQLKLIELSQELKINQDRISSLLTQGILD